MAPKLRDALKLSQEAASWRSPRICEEQCSILRSALIDLANFLKEIQECPQIQNSALDWEEVNQVIRRGCELLQCCEQEEDWVLRALLYEESRADFQDVHSEVYLCVEMISQFLTQTPGSNQDIKSTVSEARSKCLAAKTPLADAAAVKDRRELVKLALEREKRNQTSSSSSSSSSSSTSSKKNQALIFLCSKLVERASPDSENLHLMIEYSQIKLKKHLGAGNYGAVYDASWANYEHAVKVFHPGDLSFPRELSALACYKHPNILHIVGYSHNPSTRQHCLVMEKMETDLESLIEKKKLKQRDGETPLHQTATLSILLQIAKGMAWLDASKVIHRDLKPQNILLSKSKKQSWYAQAPESFFVKIADFGLARTKFVTSQLSYATPKRGTRAFSAPEVWSSEHYSKKSDVYSFGMVCYQLLTGNAPFHNVNTLEPDFMKRVAGENGLRPRWPELTSGWAVEVAKLVRQCWSFDPKERPDFSSICDMVRVIKSQAWRV